MSDSDRIRATMREIAEGAVREAVRECGLQGRCVHVLTEQLEPLGVYEVSLQASIVEVEPFKCWRFLDLPKAEFFVHRVIGTPAGQVWYAVSERSLGMGLASAEGHFAYSEVDAAWAQSCRRFAQLGPDRVRGSLARGRAQVLEKHGRLPVGRPAEDPAQGGEGSC